MSSARQAFHIGVVAYYVMVSYWMKENMLNQKDDEKLDPILRTLKRFSLRYLTNWTFIKNWPINDMWARQLARAISASVFPVFFLFVFCGAAGFAGCVYILTPMYSTQRFSCFCTLQTIYFFIALGEDALQLFKKQEKIKSRVTTLKNYIFSVLVAPMALLVSIVFWGIWMVDRELIFPSIMDKVLPSWANHALHTTTSILVLCEMYLSFHKYPAFKPALLGITLYLLFYSICLVGTYLESGVWLYPIFKMLNWTLRIVICLAIYILAIALYGAGYFVNKVLWDGQTIVKKAPKKKHKKH